MPLSELLAGIETGKSFKCDERPPGASEVGVVKVSAVSWGEYREQESKTCMDATRANADLYIRPGDFLFSRANTIELVGACVIARQVHRRVMLSDKILRFKFISENMKGWVLQYLRSQAGRTQIQELASGNQESMRNIGQERVGQVLVQVPPTNERVKVIDKLDELLSTLASGGDELANASRKLTQYRQSLLKAAVEGDLTAGRGSRWPMVSVADLPGLTMANGRSVPTAEAGAKVLRLTAVRNSRIDLTQFKRGAWSQADAAPFTVQEGDLLVVRGNGSLGLVGRAGLVPVCAEPIAYPDTLIRVRAAPEVVRPAWLACVWDSQPVRTHIESRARTSAGIYKISQPDIASATLPLPSIEEQDVTLAALEAAMAPTGAVEAEILSAARLAAAQRQNILRAAFSGQLVPQDPNDEPAGVLLARIRAEREATGSKPATRRGRKAKIAV